MGAGRVMGWRGALRIVIAVTVCGSVASALEVTIPVPVVTAGPAAEGACDLLRGGSDDPTIARCATCHPRHDAHPVDVDYGRAAARPGLRPRQEVVRRGVFLPGGKITCLTCHEARSPWKYRIALPPGATPQPAVNPRDRATYAPPNAARQLPVAEGGAVTPTPLCKACHAFD